MHITYESGTVVEMLDTTDGPTAMVEMDPPQEGEEKCATCRMCSASADCKRVLCARIAGESLSVTQGSRVLVEISRPLLYVPMILTLLVPLLGMVAGAVAGYILWRGHNAQDLMSALLAFAGGATLFGVGYVIARKTSSQAVNSASIKEVL
jgi:positive regulator of sigma E activity